MGLLQSYSPDREDLMPAARAAGYKGSAREYGQRRGHCRSRSLVAFSASCSLIVPSNSQVRVEAEFQTRDATAATSTCGDHRRSAERDGCISPMLNLAAAMVEAPD